jgi:hypothetical protein
MRYKESLFNSILFALLCVCNPLYAQETYTINFDEKDFPFKVENNIVEISTVKSDVIVVGDTVSPALPYFGYRILIPNSQSAKEFNATITKKLICQNVKIVANPEMIPTNALNDDSDYRLASRSVLSPVQWSGDNYCAGYKYGYFSITPFVYDVDTQKLYFVSSIQLTILNTPDNEKVNNPVKIACIEKREDVQSMLFNPEKMDEYYPVSSSTKQEQPGKGMNTTTIDYVIITNNSLLESFKELARWKTMKGVRTEVVSKDDIDIQYSGSTIQQKIKNFLQYYHNTYGTTYALFGGDDTIVPAQYCSITAGGQSGYGPTDLYYAAFSWNGSNIVGDQSALEPDIYLTRLPVRTASDVTAITNKIIKYEQNPVSLSKKALFLAGKLYTDVGGVSDSKIKCTTLANTLFSGFTNTILSESNSNSNLLLTTSNIKTQLNSNHYYVYVSTHGSTSSWLKDNSGTTLFSTSNVSQLENTYHPIIVTEACNTNRFDSEPCLSEAFIRAANKGAVAYFGSSREGWTYKYFTSGYGPSYDYNYEFFRHLLTGLPSSKPYHFGAVAAEAKAYMLGSCNTSSTNSEYYRWLQYYINPVGDAEMPLYTANPTSISNPVITRSGSNVSVKITTGGPADIILTSIDEAHSTMKKATNVANNSTYTFSGITEPYNIVITAHNRKPFVYDYMKKTRTDGIKTKTVSGTKYYYLNINPDSVTINWTLPSPYSSLVHANPSALNECYITESGSTTVTTTLTGTVKVNGRQVETFQKSVTITVTGFSGTYSQAACTYNGVSHPAIPATPYYSSTSTTYFIHQGCQVTLTSSNFTGMYVTYGGPATPTGWSQYDDTHVRFSLPSSSNGLPLYVYVKDSNGNTLYTSVFLGVFNNGNLSGYSMAVSPTGSGFEIDILADEEGQTDNGERGDNSAISEWDIEVYNVLKGTKVLSEHVIGSTYLLDTTGWEAGLYAVRAIINGEVISEKIMVK